MVYRKTRWIEKNSIKSPLENYIFYRWTANSNDISGEGVSVRVFAPRMWYATSLCYFIELNEKGKINKKAC